MPEVAETGATFVENALIKARHACRATAPPRWQMTLVWWCPHWVAPRVTLGRYSGHGDQANNALLQKTWRHFRRRPLGILYCRAGHTAHADDPSPLIAEGRWSGSIAITPRGDSGFGYDPLFIPDGESRHAAELTAEEKNLISHRGKALTRLIKLAQA